MGDIADMMIDGTLDYQTGEYIGNGGGYPRTMNGRGFPQTLKPNTQTVWNYLVQKGITVDYQKSQTIQKYGQYKGLVGKRNSKVCDFIRETPQNWKDFKWWVENQVLNK